MEKGNVIASKSNSSEPKGKPGENVANKHLHLPRVKDSGSPRPDGRRKSNPQKSQECFDKRPRNRGNTNQGRYRNELTEDFIDYEGKKGGKKTSLNHLLNFHLAQRRENWEGRGSRSTYHRPKHPKYDKELFLQANCQFIVRNDGDYKVQEINPDKIVEWSFIEEICLPCHEVPLCPICLHVPVAAKITRCGHVYCWPCMLHYLALTDKTWQKCPICFEAVHKPDLKSVSLQVRKSFLVGDEITMCLMKREKGTLHVSRFTSNKSSQAICNANKEDETARYQKVLLASIDEVQCIVNREHNELDEAYINEKDTPEACFIESALKLLQERELNLNKADKHQGDLKEEPEKPMYIPTRKYLTSTSSVDSNEGSLKLDMNKNPSKLTDSSEGGTTRHISEPDKNLSIFYQAEDGQHIYMHNINIRMLIREYGSLENAPHVITAKLVEIERVSMTEILRKRLQYLKHLPLTCEFQIVELDFSKEVSQATFQQFEKEIHDRSLARSKKARNERRRERMIEQEENKKLGKYPKAKYNLNSIDQFPAYNPKDFESHSYLKSENTIDGQNSDPEGNFNLNSMDQFPVYNQDVPSDPKPENAIGCINSDDEISLLNSRLDSAFQDVVSEENCTASSNSPVTSFAQLLKDGKTFSSTPREVKRADPAPELLSDNEEIYQAPSNHSFSDAFQAALDSVSVSNTTNKSKKKKRGQRQVLLTNSMSRGYCM